MWQIGLGHQWTNTGEWVGRWMDGWMDIWVHACTWGNGGKGYTFIMRIYYLESEDEKGMNPWAIFRKGNWWDLHVVVVQWLSCIWLFCNPMDCSPPASSVHGISQAKILEWVATSFCRGLSQGRQILYHWATKEVQDIHIWGQNIKSLVIKYNFKKQENPSPHTDMGCTDFRVLRMHLRTPEDGVLRHHLPVGSPTLVNWSRGESPAYTEGEQGKRW